MGYFCLTGHIDDYLRYRSTQGAAEAKTTTQKEHASRGNIQGTGSGGAECRRPGKFIDILTENNTVQEVYVRGAKKASSAATSLTQLFSYAVFSIQQRNGRVYLDSAEPIRIFYRLRESLSRLSLAMYFSELIRLSVREFRPAGETCEVMRLMLNTLHYLENGSREEGLLKPIFELRLMTELGMMPDLLMCRTCGEFLPKTALFLRGRGLFFMSGMRCFLPHAKSDFAPRPCASGHAAHCLCRFPETLSLSSGCRKSGRRTALRRTICTISSGSFPEALTFYHKITAPVLHSEEEPHEQEL